MKSKDLRIGNYVQYKDTKEQTKIYELQHKYKNTYSINDFNDNPHLEPIPLTEQWLLSLGAIRSDTDRNRFYLNGLEIYIFTDNDNNPTKIIFNPSSAILYVNLKHVHQLQNLVHALTSKELEIKQHELN